MFEGPATLDQYKGAITEAIAFQKSRDPHFSPPSELEELCRPAHLSTQAAGPLTSTHVQGIASQPAGLMSSTRKRPSSGAYATISQSQWSGEKKEVIAACSPECESKKRRKKSSGMTRTQSRKKRLTDSSPIHPNTNPSNGTSDSCSASLSTVDACPNGGDGGGGGGGGSGGGVLAGLKPPCGVQSHQSVGSEGAMEEKLPKDHASSVNGKDNTGQSGATTNGCHHAASVSGNKRGALVSGNRRGASACGNRKGALVSGNRRGALVSGNRKGALVSGNRRGALVSGNRRGALVSGNRRGALVSGNRRGALVSGNRRGALVSGNRRGALVCGNRRGASVRLDVISLHWDSSPPLSGYYRRVRG